MNRGGNHTHMCVLKHIHKCKEYTRKDGRNLNCVKEKTTVLKWWLLR